MLKKLTTVAAAIVAVAAAVAAPINALAYQAEHHEIITKRVVIRFLEKDALADACGARARACAYTNANIIILPADEAYGWTGTVTARVKVQWHDKKSLRDLDCGSKYACVKDDVVHAVDLSFEHRGLVWIGEAYAKVIGLDYNPRRVELLAHELKHVLTGERHAHS